MTIHPPHHSECAADIRQIFAARGGDVTVSTQPPLVNGPYTGQSYTCPHGTRYWVEPTGEQIAKWAKDAADQEAGQ